MNSAVDENSWRNQDYRSNVVQKIEEAIQKCGMPTNKTSVEMENHVYQKAKIKDEYLSYIARLILHIREMNSKKKNQIPGQQPHSVGPHTRNSKDELRTKLYQKSMDGQVGNSMSKPLPGQVVNVMGQQVPSFMSNGMPPNQMNVPGQLNHLGPLQSLCQVPNQFIGQSTLPPQPSPIEMSWITQPFRSHVIQEIEEAVLESGIPASKTSVEMENHVYQKAKTTEEYLSYAARVILHVRGNSNEKNQMSGQQPQAVGVPPNQINVPGQMGSIMMVPDGMTTPGLGNLPNAAYIQSPFQVPNQFIGQNTLPPQPSPIDTSWRTQASRSNVIQKIEEAILKSGMPISETSVEMENHIYQKAKTKDEYSSYVTRLILLFIDSNERNQMLGQQPQSEGPPTQDLIDELS